VLEGSLPLGGRPLQVLRTVGEPTGYAADVFRAALAQQGIKLRGSTSTGPTPPNPVELASLQSMPLAELDVPFLKLSNNTIAEILVKSMGRQVYGDGSWPAGLQAVRDYLVRAGLNTDTLQLEDGSGLSELNLLTPEQVTRLLVYVQQEPWFDDWYAALPVAGTPGALVGGTLEARMVDTPAAGNAHAKTGSLVTASALSGYVDDAAGDRLVFSAIENHYLGSAPKDIEDALVEALASYSESEARVE
jgi:D-alanyl-D-alanine carboxypeptidase/D-alanyl-D-alanine-endopeptidase (penicillin-binding protein 4)